jgi:hypothetical protein
MADALRSFERAGDVELPIRAYVVAGVRPPAP